MDIGHIGVERCGVFELFCPWRTIWICWKIFQGRSMLSKECCWLLSELKATKIGLFTRESVHFNAVSLKKYFSFITAKISRLRELCEGSVDSNTSALTKPWWTWERSESTGSTAWKQTEESSHFPSGKSCQPCSPNRFNPLTALVFQQHHSLSDTPKTVSFTIPPSSEHWSSLR